MLPTLTLQYLSGVDGFIGATNNLISLTTASIPFLLCHNPLLLKVRVIGWPSARFKWLTGARCCRTSGLQYLKAPLEGVPLPSSLLDVCLAEWMHSWLNAAPMREEVVPALGNKRVFLFFLNSLINNLIYLFPSDYLKMTRVCNNGSPQYLHFATHYI